LSPAESAENRRKEKLNFGFHRQDYGIFWANLFQPLYFLKRSGGEPVFHWNDQFILIYIYVLFLPLFLWMCPFSADKTLYPHSTPFFY